MDAYESLKAGSLTGRQLAPILATATTGIAEVLADYTRRRFGALHGEEEPKPARRETKEEATLRRLGEFYSKPHGDHRDFGCRRDQMDAFAAALTGIDIEKIVEVRESATGSGSRSDFHMAVVQVIANNTRHCYPQDKPTLLINSHGSNGVLCWDKEGGKRSSFGAGDLLNTAHDFRVASEEEILELATRMVDMEEFPRYFSRMINAAPDLSEVSEDQLRASKIWSASESKNGAFRQQILDTFGVDSFPDTHIQEYSVVEISGTLGADDGGVFGVNSTSSSLFSYSDMFGIGRNEGQSVGNSKLSNARVLSREEVLAKIGLSYDDFRTEPAAPETAEGETEAA